MITQIFRLQCESVWLNITKMESNKDVINAEEGEEDIEMKFPLLSFEKQIFIDAFEKDALVIMAKYVLPQQLASNWPNNC